MSVIFAYGLMSAPGAYMSMSCLGAYVVRNRGLSEGVCRTGGVFGRVLVLTDDISSPEEKSKKKENNLKVR